MPLTDEWWDRVARMQRPALISTLMEETERANRLEEQVDILQAELKPEVAALHQAVKSAPFTKKKLFVAHAHLTASMCAKRMGIAKQRVVLISTSSISSLSTIRGYRLSEENVVLVPGWTLGQYHQQVQAYLGIAGVDIDRCVYGPSPEQDRMEGESNWGRREAQALADARLEVSRLKCEIKPYELRYGDSPIPRDVIPPYNHPNDVRFTRTSYATLKDNVS